ncbi:MAG TPA: hypothetical protein DIC36_05840, partial [Gammaproteobacteria bacterium]|nr:hypothetical protein [Gammaproteobacteria bacterium]
GYDTVPATPEITKYSDFWSTHQGTYNVANGKGLADYSNRGFFTAGTNLGDNDYAYPPNNPNSSQYKPYYFYSTGKAITMLKYQVPDKLAQTTDDMFVTSESVVTRFLVNRNHYFLTTANYNNMADLLIPRAVAYSAGMINYFFRGRLEIAPPANGVYAVIDDGAPHQRGNDGIAHAGEDGSGPIFGFNKLRLQLRNATPNGEAMANGTVYAVVKYHANTCYDPHLTGEYRRINQIDTQPVCDKLEEKFWSGEEKIAVSEPIVMAVDPSYKTLEFTFTDANVLPVNAHSLYLQVVYRGILGQEEDAVAVATLDIHEPSYFMISNDTDYQCLDDTFYSKSAVITIIENELKASAILGTPQSPTLDRITLAGGNLQSFTYDKLDFVVGGSAGVPVSLRQPLAPASYLRLAVLGGNTGTKFGSFSASVTLNGKATSVPLDNDNGFVIYPHRVALAWGDNPRVTDHLGQFRGAYFKANYHLKTPDVNCTIAGGAAYNPEQEMQFGNFAEGDLLPKSVEVKVAP